MEDKLENLQALIEGSGLGDVRQKVRGMSEARVLWVLDGYKVDGLPSGREFFVEMGFAGARATPVEGACGRRL